MTSGKKLILTDVFFASSVRKNLVSGIVLNKCGFKMIFEAIKFVLSKGGIFVGQGFLCDCMLCDCMFKLNMNKVDLSLYLMDDSRFVAF